MSPARRLGSTCPQVRVQLVIYPRFGEDLVLALSAGECQRDVPIRR